MQSEEIEITFEDVINNIQNAKEFKRLLREIANTSQVLYRCFRRAFRHAKKSATNGQSICKKQTICDKCLQRFHKKPVKTCSKKKPMKHPCEPVTVCVDPNIQISFSGNDNSVCDMAECNYCTDYKALQKTTSGQSGNTCGMTGHIDFELNEFGLHKLDPNDYINECNPICERFLRTTEDGHPKPNVYSEEILQQSPLSHQPCCNIQNIDGHLVCSQGQITQFVCSANEICNHHVNVEQQISNASQVQGDECQYFNDAKQSSSTSETESMTSRKSQKTSSDTSSCHSKLDSQNMPIEQILCAKCKKVLYDSQSNMAMCPISFFLPVDLQTQTSNNETRFGQIQNEMDATVEQPKPEHMHKYVTSAADAIKPATVPTSTCQTQTDIKDVLSHLVSSSNQPEWQQLPEYFSSLPSSMVSLVDEIAVITEEDDSISSGNTTPTESRTSDKKRRVRSKHHPLTVPPPMRGSSESQSSALSQPIPSVRPPTQVKAERNQISTSAQRPPQSSEANKPRNYQTQTPPEFERDLSPSPVLSLSHFIQEAEREQSFPVNANVDTLNFPINTRPKYGQTEPSQRQQAPAYIKNKNELTETETGDEKSEVLIETLNADRQSVRFSPPNIKLNQRKSPSSSAPTVLPNLPAVTSATLTPKPSDAAIVKKKSAIVQTDILSNNTYSHLKRNDMRQNIVAGLTELLKPSTEKSAYRPDEKDEVIKDLRNLFKPNRNVSKYPSDESRESVLENINLLLNHRDEIKRASISSGSSSKRKSWRKSKSTEVIIKNIRHILNPKGPDKPSKHFSTDNREHMLQSLHTLLARGNQRQEESNMQAMREGVLLDLRFLLSQNKEEYVRSSGQQQQPKMKPKVKPKPKPQSSKPRLEGKTSLQRASIEMKAAQRGWLNKLDAPITRMSQLRQSLQRQNSSDEDIQPPSYTRESPSSAKILTQLEENLEIIEEEMANSSEPMPSSDTSNSNVCVDGGISSHLTLSYLLFKILNAMSKSLHTNYQLWQIRTEEDFLSLAKTIL